MPITKYYNVPSLLECVSCAFQYDLLCDWTDSSWIFYRPGSGAVLLFCCRVTSVRMEENELLSCWKSKDPNNRASSTGRVRHKSPFIFTAVFVYITLCQNDGRNRPVPSTSSQRRDPAFGKGANTKTHFMQINLFKATFLSRLWVYRVTAVWHNPCLWATAKQ